MLRFFFSWRTSVNSAKTARNTAKIAKNTAPAPAFTPINHKARKANKHDPEIQAGAARAAATRRAAQKDR